MDTHVASHMLLDDLIGWTMISRIQSIPYTIPFVNRYVTCPRLDRRYPNTLFSLVTGKSLYSYRNAWSRVQHLGHIELIMMMHYRVAQRYLSVIRSDKSQSRSVSTQQILSEIPVMHLYSHPVTLWRLIHPRHSYGIRELHDLMVEGRDTWHLQSSSKTNYTIFYAMLRIGSCPSHHSPNDVILLSMTSNVHGQEAVTIYWLMS